MTEYNSGSITALTPISADIEIVDYTRFWHNSLYAYALVSFNCSKEIPGWSDVLYFPIKARMETMSYSVDGEILFFVSSGESKLKCVNRVPPKRCTLQIFYPVEN